MRKVLVVLLLFIIIVIVFFYIDNLLYSPLKQREFQKLFLYSGDVKKKSSVDYIKLSIRGEIFDMYLYKTPPISLSLEEYPNFSGEWENKELTNEVIVSKWKACPFNAIAEKRCKFAFISNSTNNEKHMRTFLKELHNSYNYYSFVYFSEQEHYFLLFCPKQNILYYVRVRF